MLIETVVSYGIPVSAGERGVCPKACRCIYTLQLTGGSLVELRVSLHHGVGRVWFGIGPLFEVYWRNYSVIHVDPKDKEHISLLILFSSDFDEQLFSFEQTPCQCPYLRDQNLIEPCTVNLLLICSFLWCSTAHFGLIYMGLFLHQNLATIFVLYISLCSFSSMPHSKIPKSDITMSWHTAVIFSPSLSYFEIPPNTQ